MTATDADVVVVGAGFAGIYAVHALRGRGLHVTGFESGSGVGGTWFWNRYPGARCDVESLDYQYAFDPGINDGWTWSERYATAPEILRYADWVADRLGVRSAFRFGTTVTSARYDEREAVWEVVTSDGTTTRARFVVAASGSISATSVPPFAGVEDFEGLSLHPGRWPHDGVDLSGARVAVIGVGSSGVQLIPELARTAAELTVFQRTPAYTIPARNRPLYADEVIRARKQASQRADRRRASPSGLSDIFTTQTLRDTPEPERSRRLDEAWKLGGNLFFTTFIDAPVDPESNERLADYVRDRIAETVEDPETAEALTPRDYPIGGKRIVTDTDFHATFNLPHVDLVDLRADPIERITPRGVATGSGERPFDVIVYATGYDNLTGALTRVDYRGRDGVALADAWRDGVRTYLGIQTAGFPNLFMITGPQSPSVLVNMFAAIEQHVEWVVDAITRLGTGGAAIEPREASEQEWSETVEAAFGRTLKTRARSWYRGQNIEGKPTRALVYAGGLLDYRRRCDAEAENGYPGFHLTGAEPVSAAGSAGATTTTIAKEYQP
ncbi:NAD(P)/FAD-dependent oxidoreductase [Streptomyces sp. MS2A]|nr:NAD(P)/FAD-dependent oxidoreductase [Streptomyces sp. MS2A]